LEQGQLTKIREHADSKRNDTQENQVVLQKIYECSKDYQMMQLNNIFKRDREGEQHMLGSVELANKNRHSNVYSIFVYLFGMMVFLLCENSIAETSNDKLQSTKLRILAWEGYAEEKYIEQFRLKIEREFKLKLDVEVTYPSDPQDFFDAIRGDNTDIISPAHHIPK